MRFSICTLKQRGRLFFKIVTCKDDGDLPPPQDLLRLKLRLLLLSCYAGSNFFASHNLKEQTPSLFQCTYAKSHGGDSVVPGRYRCTDLNTLCRQGADLFALFYPNHIRWVSHRKESFCSPEKGNGKLDK